MRSSPQHGFIALMSVIIISAILLVVAVGGSLMSVYARFDMLDAEQKERSAALADACADTLVARIGGDPTYPASTPMPETITISGSDQCQILGSLNPGSNPRVFKIQGIFQHAYTDVLITVDTGTLAITSWQEVPHF